MTKRYCTEEDVRQTVNLTFLQCVKRYEKRDSEKGPIPFSAFLYSYFFYLLKKNVDTFLIDQLGRKSFPLYTEGSTGEDGSDHVEGFNVDTIEHAVRDLIFSNNVDEFWVLGESTQPPFDQLTVQERQLIKWKYVDGKKSSEIAAKITEHPNTVREHISKVKIKLKDILLLDGMEEFLLITNIERK
jgi:hypothetical protein